MRAGVEWRVCVSSLDWTIFVFGEGAVPGMDSLSDQIKTIARTAAAGMAIFRLSMLMMRWFR